MSSSYMPLRSIYPDHEAEDSFLEKTKSRRTPTKLGVFALIVILSISNIWTVVHFSKHLEKPEPAPQDYGEN